MAQSDAARQRRKRVLGDSTKRLNSLSKPEYDDDESEPPTSFVEEVFRTQSGKKTPAKKKEDKSDVYSLNHVSTRRIAFFNILSYVVSFIFGTYACYTLHAERVSMYCPFFFRGLFFMMDKFGVGRMINHAMDLWINAPLYVHKKTVMALTYGSMMMSLYPLFSSFFTTNGKKKPSETENSNEEEEKADQYVDISEEQLIRFGSFVARSAAACLVFGLLGYDGLYNMQSIITFLR
uniref:Uncharacterized protein n=1 Tax=Babesia bovis TaxID=5865 RepID=S6B8B3_BABBO|nr:conserved hypothetical protein [Babesia bovis]